MLITHSVSRRPPEARGLPGSAPLVPAMRREVSSRQSLRTSVCGGASASGNLPEHEPSVSEGAPFPFLVSTTRKTSSSSSLFSRFLDAAHISPSAGPAHRRRFSLGCRLRFLGRLEKPPVCLLISSSRPNICAVSLQKQRRRRRES